jgi:hypothetical protein
MDKVEKLSTVLFQMKKYRLEFQLQKQLNDNKIKNDEEIQLLVQSCYGEECSQFVSEFPHLFAFVCSSKTSEESVSKIEHAIRLKEQIVKGQISEEVGKKIFMESVTR